MVGLAGVLERVVAGWPTVDFFTSAEAAALATGFAALDFGAAGLTAGAVVARVTVGVADGLTTDAPPALRNGFETFERGGRLTGALARHPRSARPARAAGFNPSRKTLGRPAARLGPKNFS